MSAQVLVYTKASSPVLIRLLYENVCVSHGSRARFMCQQRFLAKIV